MERLFALTLAPIVLMSACSAVVPAPDVPQRPPVPAPSADTCNAAQYASLVGQDATALERVLIMGQVRVIRPAQAVSMDFRPARINFNIGPDNRITSISCQ